MTKTYTIEELGFDFPMFTKPSDVMHWLHAEGIRGLRHEPTQCPIVRKLWPLITETWPTVQYAGVVATKAEDGKVYGYLRVFDGITDFLVELPQLVLEFVWHFDRGAYPELERS